jgi:putative transposase
MNLRLQSSGRDSFGLRERTHGGAINEMVGELKDVGIAVANSSERIGKVCSPSISSPWRRLYVLFFIKLGSRGVHLAGCTPNPSAPWVIQRARQLTWTLVDRPEPIRFLIRDRDQKFNDGFDEVFRSDRIEIVRTPFRTPQANGVAERFVRTARSECLDWLLILNQRHLERSLEVFVTHYNGDRPHRALSLLPPEPKRAPSTPTRGAARVECRDLLVV